MIARAGTFEFHNRNRFAQSSSEGTKAGTDRARGGARRERVRRRRDPHEDIARQVQLEFESRWETWKERADPERQDVQPKSIPVWPKFRHGAAIWRAAGHAGAALAIRSDSSPLDRILVGKDRWFRLTATAEQLSLQRGKRGWDIPVEHYVVSEALDPWPGGCAEGPPGGGPRVREGVVKARQRFEEIVRDATANQEHRRRARRLRKAQAVIEPEVLDGLARAESGDGEHGHRSTCSQAPDEPL
jgi:hypothetical protein